MVRQIKSDSERGSEDENILSRHLTNFSDIA